MVPSLQEDKTDFGIIITVPKIAWMEYSGIITGNQKDNPGQFLTG
jgi:hypothetical protein